MYFFTTFLLFAFGTMALTMTFHHLFKIHRDRWTMTSCFMGVAMAWLANFSMWPAFHVAVRYDWVGTTLTGFALAGTALLLHTFLGFFSGLDRKLHDQAEVMETHELRKVA